MPRTSDKTPLEMIRHLRACKDRRVASLQAEIIRAGQAHDEAVRAIESACTHRHPDGRSADDGGMFYGFCTLCGAGLDI